MCRPPSIDVVLVLTCSMDTTTDLILDRLGDLPVFRFNIDRWREHAWSVTSSGYWLSDPTGRECRERDVRAVYLRKLIFDPPYIDIPAGGSEEHWARQQLEQVWLGLRDLALERGRLALVHPSPRGKWSKIRQMRVAARHFRVPEWAVFRGPSPAISPPVVVKTFAPAPVGGGALMDVRQVDSERLSPDYPWFLQQRVAGATHDVTVAWIRGRPFSYELDRSLFAGDDCRFPSTLEGLPWTKCELSADETAAVNDFMAATGYSFGRLDFLKAEDGTLWFLEINPNGQFAWLDEQGRDGLLDAVAEEIRRVHELV